MNAKIMEVKTKALNGGKMTQIVFNGDESLNQLILDEVFGKEIYKKLITKLKGVKKPVIVDLGAHIGLSSLYFTQVKDAVIHSVEPNPYNFAMLTENTKDYPQITRHQVAITGANTQRFLYSDKDGSMSESLYETKGEKIPVTGITLKTFMENVNLKRINALKIDVEGTEYEIFLLPAFKEVADKIDFIIGEAHYHPGIAPMVVDLLKPHGFKVKFLPYKNLTETYKITFEDGREYSVETKLNTIFTAER